MSKESLDNSILEVTTLVDSREGGRRDIPMRQLHQMEGYPGVWEHKVDVKRDLGIVGPKAYEELSQLSK